ncbi:unnamed protein product [Ectocarpus sp. CCAP 1310/34]|nr:unnamed protein product [Ectocarpus sp. CCAP 1310/34]
MFFGYALGGYSLKFEDPSPYPSSAAETPEEQAGQEELEDLSSSFSYSGSPGAYRLHCGMHGGNTLFLLGACYPAEWVVWDVPGKTDGKWERLELRWREGGKKFTISGHVGQHVRWKDSDGFVRGTRGESKVTDFVLRERGSTRTSTAAGPKSALILLASSWVTVPGLRSSLEFQRPRTRRLFEFKKLGRTGRGGGRSRMTYIRINGGGRKTPLADLRTLVEMVWKLPGLTSEKLRRKSAETVDGQTEVETPVGIIDVLSKTEVIEMKYNKKWKHALGQVLDYHLFYPRLAKRLHLFAHGGEAGTSMDFDLAKAVCMICMRCG